MKQINIALQVLPRSENKDTYDLVDIAIDLIQNSGLKYRVCPFETVIEGEFDEIMALVKKIHEKLYEQGAESMLAYLKIQSNKNIDITIKDKIAKYD